MNKMNTLAFVNFLLIKLFPTLIRQNFPLSKICAIRYISFSMVILNSRDWWEIVQLPENSALEKSTCNRFYPKIRLECTGKAVMMLYLD